MFISFWKTFSPSNKEALKSSELREFCEWLVFPTILLKVKRHLSVNQKIIRVYWSNCQHTYPLCALCSRLVVISWAVMGLQHQVPSDNAPSVSKMATLASSKLGAYILCYTRMYFCQPMIYGDIPHLRTMAALSVNSDLSTCASRQLMHGANYNSWVCCKLPLECVVADSVAIVMVVPVYTIILSRFAFAFTPRKRILDTNPEDTNYNPLPEEERPGGFDWGEGQRPQDQQGNDQDQQGNDQEQQGNDQGQWDMGWVLQNSLPSYRRCPITYASVTLEVTCQTGVITLWSNLW